jgi:predicted amidohydrolase
MIAPWTLALAQYPIERPAAWDDYAASLAAWVAEAADAGARLMVFPEYGSMALTGLLPGDLPGDLRGQLVALQPLLPQYLELHQALARHYHAWLLAASFPIRLPDGTYRNRAYLIGPAGQLAWQEKLTMTRFEREEWGITGGSEAAVFATPLGTLGITICYDLQFPLLAHRLAEAGAQLILGPSCTDGRPGHHRVHTGARARALENQCLVAVSPTVGDAPWSPAVDTNVGYAALYGPCDRGFPADGTLARGELNEPGWVYAEVDLARIAHVRQDGQVLNYRHWPEQFPAKPLVRQVLTG